MKEESFIQHLFAERIGGSTFGKSTKVYKFAKIKQIKVAAQKEQPSKTLIDLGVGEPDAMAYPSVVEALAHEAAKPENRFYADRGCQEFLFAVRDFMERNFKVALSPEREILHSIGSKSALSLLPACFVNPGDYVLMTTPGYPVFGVHSAYYGGNIHHLPLLEENQFLPQLASIDKSILAKAKVLVLNYPNNPTGASATYEFFEQCVHWAKKNKIILIHDAAYAALVYKTEPLSLLQIPGAKEVTLELHSLSKSFNMTGWRLGWVCGNPLLVEAYGVVKDNSDSGQFLAIQKASAKALEDVAILKELSSKYNRRLQILCDALTQAGFCANKPKGGFFIYCKAPNAVLTPKGDSVEFKNAEDFSHWLIKNELISTVPWDEAGAFVRFSATFDAPDQEQEIAVMDQLKERLCPYKFIFSSA